MKFAPFPSRRISRAMNNDSISRIFSRYELYELYNHRIPLHRILRCFRPEKSSSSLRHCGFWKWLKWFFSTLLRETRFSRVESFSVARSEMYGLRGHSTELIVQAKVSETKVYWQASVENFNPILVRGLCRFFQTSCSGGKTGGALNMSGPSCRTSYVRIRLWCLKNWDLHL